MRPTLISLEESLLAKLNPIINAFKDNQQIANKSQLLPILLTLNKSIMRLKADHARSTALMQLKTLMDNFIRVTTESETVMVHFETKISQLDVSDKRPTLHKLIDFVIQEQPDEDPAEVAATFMSQQQLLFNHLAAAERYLLAYKEAFKNFFGIGYGPSDHNCPSNTRFIAMR